MASNYMNNSNMSGIKESIQQYSMNFDNSNEQAISQMISVSKTNKHISTSKVPLNRNSYINISNGNNPPIKEDESIQQDSMLDKQNTKGQQNTKNQPIFLGDNVYNCIQERFAEVNKINTKDPQVLFQFFKLQRKNFNSSKSKSSNITLESIASLMPSAQRKMLIKVEFQKILKYYAHDVYYTLLCGAEKQKKDQQLQNKINLLNTQMTQPKNVKKSTKQVTDRLYTPKIITTIIKAQKPKQQISRQQRYKFGVKLHEIYENNFRKNAQPPLQTLDKLVQFWQDMYQRDQYGVQWSEQTIRQDLKLYMTEQVQTLQIYLSKKLGFKQFKGQDLYKFYMKYKPIERVHIPTASFKQYLNVFNDVQKQKQSKHQQQWKKAQKQAEQKKKLTETKKFGRPISSTPISVLARPKSANNVKDLAERYSQDKLLSTMLHTDKMKMARHAWQYGIHNLQEQVKVKGRVKPNQKQLFDKTIFKMLDKTFANQSFLNVNDDRVRDILGQQDIQKNEHWNQLGPILQQAMLVKCYEQNWFRESLLKYSAKTVEKDLKYADDKTIVTQIMKYFNHLAEDDRRDQISNFDNVIHTSATIAERTQQIIKLSKKGQNFEKKQKSLFYVYLEEKACEFVDSRIKKKQINLKKFLNQIFQTALKDHKEFTTKYFHVIKGDKECPKLLKYEFFRLQKEINPFTKQRDQISKCHAWIPTKNTPEDFNYKTYNSYANMYVKDKSKIVAKPQGQEYKNSIWGRKRGKDRQRLMMSYQDAKQCVFHPRISRKGF